MSNTDKISKLVLVEKKGYRDSYKGDHIDGTLAQGPTFSEESHIFTSDRKLTSFMRKLKSDQKRSVEMGVPAYSYSIKIKDVPEGYSEELHQLRKKQFES